MGMKEGRDQRRDELIKQFVSVENLIEQLSKETGLGIDEVAAEFMLMHKKAEDSDLPVFGSIDESFFRFHGLKNAYQHREVLYEMLDETIDGFGHGDRSDHFGWMKDDLLSFLRKIGCDVPIEIPVWQPKEVLKPSGMNDRSDHLGAMVGVEKPLGARERDTLLCIIAGLARQLGIKPNEIRGAATQISEWTELVDAKVSDDTIREKLKLIPEALERRST